ncbi:hypothetical protein D3C72_2197980 [compost metagenome]
MVLSTANCDTPVAGAIAVVLAYTLFVKVEIPATLRFLTLLMSLLFIAKLVVAL